MVLKPLPTVFGAKGLPVNQGQAWKHQRRLIQTSFHHASMAAFVPLMVECITRQLETWQDGQTIYLRPVLMRLSLEMATKVMLGLDNPATLAEIEAALQATLQLLDNPAQIEVAFPTAAKTRFHQTVQRLDALLFELIAQRRGRPPEQSDLLAYLLATRDQDGQPLSDRQIRDELVSLLRASHKNTATTLFWTWYLLAQHPPVETRLGAEVDQVLGQRQPALADLSRLPYTEQMLKESRRLYPLYPYLVREAAQDCQVGGYLIRAGGVVMVCPWLTQRDPCYFDRPTAFEPERWAAALEKQLPNFVYFPFGGGPRVCAVKGYAMLEGLLLLAMMGRRFQFRLFSSHPVQPFPFYSGLRTKREVAFVLKKR